MPSCVNCAPSGTPIVVEGVHPVVVTGSGSPTDPLIVGLSSEASNFALAVRDTDTVNLTLYGSGSSDDPYVISADTGSAFKLTDLSDVISDPPTAGQVVTWVGATIGGHWEFVTPTVNSLSQVDASILTGTIDAARLPVGVPVDGGYIDTQDWNSILTAGTYRVFQSTMVNAPHLSGSAVGVYNFGTLVVSASSNSTAQTYYEHGYDTATNTHGNLWFRNKWNVSDWTPWFQAANVSKNLLLSGTSALTAQSGFPLQIAALARTGNTVTWQATVTATAGLSNATNLDGNVPSFQIGTIPAEHAPAAGIDGHIATTGQGLALTGYVDPNGAVWISTVPSGIANTTGGAFTTATNYPIQVGGTWVAKELTS